MFLKWLSIYWTLVSLFIMVHSILKPATPKLKPPLPPGYRRQRLALSLATRQTLPEW
jgi:hypothetical protein